MLAVHDLMHTLGQREAPELHTRVLPSVPHLDFDVVLGQGNHPAVEIIPQRDAQHLHERGREVGMRGDDLGRIVGGHTRAPRDQGDIYVFLVSACLPGLLSVLSHVEAIVAAVDDVGVIEDTVFRQSVNEPIDQFVNSLERT